MAVSRDTTQDLQPRTSCSRYLKACYSKHFVNERPWKAFNKSFVPHPRRTVNSIQETKKLSAVSLIKVSSAVYFEQVPTKAVLIASTIHFANEPPRKVSDNLITQVIHTLYYSFPKYKNWNIFFVILSVFIYLV